MLTVLSFGAGQDSATLLALYRHELSFNISYLTEDFVVVFSDTGNEHPDIYVYLEEVKTICYAEEIPFFHLTPDMGYHGKNWDSLDTQMDTHGTVFSKAFSKSCTDRLKVQVIYRWLADWVLEKHPYLELEKKYRQKAPLVAYAKKYGKIQVILGIAAGEDKRVSKGGFPSKWQQEALQNIYPLRTLGMDRQACQDYLNKVGETIPWPSCCLKCPWANLQELL